MKKRIRRPSGKAVLSWVDARIEDILDRPEMFGSNHAVELQILLLLEFGYLMSGNDPDDVLSKYHRYLNEVFDPPLPVTMADRIHDSAILADFLDDFINETKRW